MADDDNNKDNESRVAKTNQVYQSLWIRAWRSAIVTTNHGGTNLKDIFIDTISLGMLVLLLLLLVVESSASDIFMVHGFANNRDKEKEKPTK